MFILNFIVLFNVKKGSVIAYRSAWVSLLSDQVFILFYNIKNKIFNYKSYNKVFYLNRLYTYRYHFTVVTSRSTSYFLFFF